MLNALAPYQSREFGAPRGVAAAGRLSLAATVVLPRKLRLHEDGFGGELRDPGLPLLTIGCY